MTADERKRMLAATFESVTASAEGWTGWSLVKTGGPTSSRRSYASDAIGEEVGTRTRCPPPHLARPRRRA